LKPYAAKDGWVVVFATFLVLAVKFTKLPPKPPVEVKIPPTPFTVVGEARDCVTVVAVMLVWSNVVVTIVLKAEFGLLELVVTVAVSFIILLSVVSSVNGVVFFCLEPLIVGRVITRSSCKNKNFIYLLLSFFFFLTMMWRIEEV
jgi:hypothetical protein